MDDDFLQRLMLFIPVLLSLTVREWAHAYAAYKLGDDTAKLLGRLSLNPLVHMDPVGTFLLPLMGVPFGWAKPVPFNPLRLKGVSIRTGILIVAAAGPISNAVIAIASFATLKILLNQADVLGEGEVFLLMFVLQVNVGLCLFNLIPIPPLDGGRIAVGLLPYDMADKLGRLEPYGFWILLALMFTGLLNVVLGMPMLLWQAWAFISPGLTSAERRTARPWIPLALLLFVVGIAVACPGDVDEVTGKMTRCPGRPEWDGLAVEDALRRHIDAVPLVRRGRFGSSLL